MQRQPPASTVIDVGATPPRLTGATLALARALWLLVVGGVAISFLVDIPGDLASARRVCDNGCLFTPAVRQSLVEAGIPFQTYLSISFGLSAVILLVALTMGLILFVRRSHEWMPLLIATYVVVYPLNNILGAFNASNVQSSWWYNAIGAAISSIGIVPFLVFPSGRFVPKWSWILLFGWVVFWIAFNVFNLDFPLGYLIIYGSLIGCQVYRYRRVSTPVERQQTKWILYGFVASLVANQLFWTPFYLPPMTPLAHTIYVPVAYLVFQASLLFVPVVFFIAVQRYNLFDIDVIINRTLVYGSLTVFLAAVYAGSVLGLQALLRLLSGQDSPVGIVASTLLIAALFSPVRRQAQRIVDRRFYRSRYDAVKVIRRFEATLRSEVELDALSLHLVDAVRAAMQPEHVSLWLSRPAQTTERTARDH